MTPAPAGPQTGTTGGSERAQPRPVRTVVITPPTGRTRGALRELWSARELVLQLAQRDVRLRYKQTFFGVAWAVMQPVVTMLVFTVFFGRLAKVPSGGLPYPAFALAALVPWTFFSTALTAASNSLISNVAMLTKVYFPRLAMPVAAVAAGLVDLAVSFVILLGVAGAYGYWPDLRLPLVLPLVLLALVSVIGPGLLLAAVNVRYRDVRYVLPFVVQLLLFASPVAYPSTLLETPQRLLYALNPMVGVIDGFRWAVLHGRDDDLPWVLAVSTGSALVLLVLGVRSFVGKQHTFADVA